MQIWKLQLPVLRTVPKLELGNQKKIPMDFSNAIYTFQRENVGHEKHVPDLLGYKNP
jgi:hypothetical protein